jgi:hypothetical protein
MVFFRITKAQFKLQGWPLTDSDIEQRVKSCFNQVFLMKCTIFLNNFEQFCFSVRFEFGWKNHTRGISQSRTFYS